MRFYASLAILVVFFAWQQPAAAKTSNPQIWSLYHKAKKARQAGDYPKGLKLIGRAMARLKRIKNKLDFSAVFAEESILQYLTNKGKVKGAKKHRTLHIVVRNAQIDTVINRVDGGMRQIKRPKKYRVTADELAKFRKEAAEFDLLCTALTRGKVVYSHDIIESESSQKDLIYRDLFKGWFGRDVYLYTANIDTIDPPLSSIIQKGYAKYDLFSIVFPATFTGKKHLGFGKGKKNTNLMEGGLRAEGLPLVPYLYYGNKRGTMINNIDKARAAQLMHEYFHLIENVLPTGYETHPWLPEKKGPKGITTETEYYQFMFDRLITAKAHSLLFKQLHGSSKLEANDVLTKSRAYASKIGLKKLRKAFTYSKLKDEASLKKALRAAPGYPAASLKLGSIYRHQGKSTEAFKLLTVNQDLDPDNDTRALQLGWFFDYNMDMGRYALPYYDKLLKRLEKSDWRRYHVVLGVARAMTDLRRYDEALELLLKPTHARLPAKKKHQAEWNFQIARIYYRQGKFAKAKKYFLKARSHRKSSKFLNILSSGKNPDVKAFEAELARIKKPSATFKSLIEAGKKVKSIKQKVIKFYQASLVKPDAWVAWFWLGYSNREAERFEAAIYSFEKMKSLSESDQVQDHYNQYVGLIHYKLDHEARAGEMLLRWARAREKKKKEVPVWCLSFLLNYSDSIRADKKSANEFAQKIIAQMKNKKDWHYQRASSWLMSRHSGKK